MHDASFSYSYPLAGSYKHVTHINIKEHLHKIALFRLQNTVSKVQFNKIENTKIYSKLDWVCKDQTDYKDDGCKYYDTFNN